MKYLLFIAMLILACQSHAQLSDFEKFDFQKADRMALACKNDGLVNLPELVHNLTAELSTDVERFRAIYRWVCGNIANDYRLYEKNMRKRQRFKDDSLKLKAWNDEFRKRSIRTMIEEKRAICTGYAYLVQEMSKLANIRCEVVNGYARTSTINVETLAMPNHSWNAVQLNGEWYLCDPTWASGIPNPNTFVFEFNYNDGFFLPPPELFAVNHYPLDTKWLLIKEGAPSFDDFLEAPIFYGSAYANLVSYSEPKKMHHNLKKHEKVTFKCQLQKPVEAKDVILLLDNGNGSIKINPENIKIVNNAVSLEYAFERSGFYDVHLMIGPDMISTYTFRVRGEDKNNYPHLPPP